MQPIRQVSIKNVMGIKDLIIDANGDLISVTGRNGTGKTSIDVALRAALRGEVSPQIVHKDAETGEVLVTLRDGTKIKRKIGKRSQLKIEDPNGHSIPSPATWLAKRFDIAAIDPVELLDASPQKRIEMIAEAAKVEIDLGDLREVLDVANIAIDDNTNPLANYVWMPIEGRSAFEEIKAITTAIVRWRAEEGKKKKEHEASINQLNQSLPDTKPEHPKALKKKIDEQTEMIQLIVEQKNDSLNEAVDAVKKKMYKKKHTMLEEKNNIESKIATLQENLLEIKSEIEMHEEVEQNEIDEAKLKVEANASESLVDAQDYMQRLVERHGVAKERKNTSEMIAHHEDMAKEAKIAWGNLQKARDNLQAYQRHLLANLGIPGLEVSDDVMYEGIHWERVNTAQRIMIAVKIAIFRGGNVVIVDRAESLDAQTLQSLVDTCEQENVQLWTLSVSNEELDVKAKDTYTEPTEELSLF